MRIGYRTIKTVIGTGLSIAVAQWLGLQFYASAGILTILCIKTTRRRSYLSARDRFLACVVGMVFASLFFEFLGYTPWIVSLLLLVVIPVYVYLKLTEGFVTGTVIMFHIYASHHVTTALIINEFALILIGVGFSLLVNLYMPSVEEQLRQYQEEIEQSFRLALFRFAACLRRGRGFDREIEDPTGLLEKAKELALRDYENHYHTGDIYFYRYFEMRERQLDNLQRIHRIILSLEDCCPDGVIVQSIMVADFLERLGRAVHAGNTAEKYLEQLAQIRQEFKQKPLPQSREEFEVRAALLQIVSEIKRYLQIKRDLAKKTTAPIAVYKSGF